MLVLTANVKREWARNGVCAHTCNGVEAFCIRTAEIVDNRLAKVIAVAQRGSGNVGDASVD